MVLSKAERDYLIRELSGELEARPDGAGKNLIAAHCPFCGKEKKFGIYIGKETERKKPFMSHCFSCGRSTYTPEQLFEEIGRPDLILTPTINPESKLDATLLFPLEQEEIDDSLGMEELPDVYRRCFTHPYLKSRGFTYEDYEIFPVGTTAGLNFKYDDYVIFPIIDYGNKVGYVARHTWSKDEIDRHNSRARHQGTHRILRFRNSIGNDFVKLLYNYDAVMEGETDTVILTEGIFDVIALTRKLELYENKHVAALATFGKKISRIQIYKIQSKGVRTVIVGYDGDAVEAIKKVADELNAYFRVLIADIPDAKKDWEDLSREEITDIFSYRLKTPREYRLTKVQES